MLFAPPDAAASRWTSPAPLLALFAAAAVALAWVFQPALAYLYKGWTTVDEYSFGILVPFISAFLFWQRRAQLAATAFEPSWTGIAVLVGGLAAGLAGYFATAQTIQSYALVVALSGLALSVAGWRAFRLLAAPLGMLLFMLPLPDLLLRELSQALQLVSSKLGVALIRAVGVTVSLEGNVIDLGTLKLQVVDACSGLRYLLPLLTLGCIMAYFFRAPPWQRIVLVGSTVPVTVLMNSARIGLIGVTAEKFGAAAAEGLLHDFEGWAVFMTCMALLFAEIALFARLSGRAFGEAFGIEFPPPLPRGGILRARPVPATLQVAAALLVLTAAGHALIPPPVSAVPPRRDFREFALQFGDWRGRPERMAREHLDILKLDDYLSANFESSKGMVNLYIGYYAAQRHGLAAHSPTECLPADGWEMRGFEQVALRGVDTGRGPLNVNRTVIQKGLSRQLVYYWFQQRERSLTGEYSVKAWLFWDLVTRQRSDGALVRLITPLAPGEDASLADARLEEFAAAVMRRLPEFVPGR